MEPNSLTEQQTKVKQLQRYIRTIAIEDARVPILSIDGFYLDETAESVSQFQNLNGMDSTGETDEKTWNEAYRQYKEIRRRKAPPIPVNIFRNPDATLQQGASGYTIYFVQTMLKALSLRYYNLGDVEITGVYDAKTEAAVRKVREATGADENIGIDKYTFDALTLLFNASER